MLRIQTTTVATWLNECRCWMLEWIGAWMNEWRRATTQSVALSLSLSLSLSHATHVQRRATSSSQSASLLSLSASLVSSSSSCLTLLYACGACLAARVLCNCLCSLIEFKCVAQYAILQNAAQTHTHAHKQPHSLSHSHTHMYNVHLTLSHDLETCRSISPATIKLSQLCGEVGGRVVVTYYYDVHRTWRNFVRAKRNSFINWQRRSCSTKLHKTDLGAFTNWTASDLVLYNVWQP